MNFNKNSNQNEFIESSPSEDSSMISASFFLKNDKTKKNSEFEEDAVKKTQIVKLLKASSKENSYFDDITKTKPLDTLRKFQQLENQIRLRAQNQSKVWDSISDIDISTDDDIKHDIINIKELQPIQQTKKYEHQKRNEAAEANTHVLTVSSSIPSVTEIFNQEKLHLKIPLPIESKNKPKITSVMKKRPNESKKSVSFDLDSHFNGKDEDISLDSFMQESVSSQLSASISEQLDKYTNDSIDSTSNKFKTKNNANDKLTTFLDRNKSSKNSIIRKVETKIVEEKGSSNISTSFRDSSNPETTSDSTSIISTDSYSINSKEAVSKSDTLKYTDTISTEIIEKSSRSRTGSFSSLMSQTTTVTSSDSYTEDFESATSSNVEHTLSYLTKDSKSKKNEETRKKPENLKFKVLKEVQTQTDEIKVSKNFPFITSESFQFNQLSSTVIPDKHVTAITSYSPSVLALQDVLKQQLLLTKDFIMRSNDLYTYALRQMKTTKHYTTLKATDKIIKQYRIKLGIDS